MAQALEDLVAGLAAGRREAFVLTQLLGCSYAEAAAVCSVPVGTVRSRVARARAALVDQVRATAAR
jgi:RNA polymerase sigma-70 factor (ECF subfamily)